MRTLFLPILAALAASAPAQSFVDNPADIPQGAPFNAGFTENVELFDLDGDGDDDALWANGGDFGNERDRVWINLGGLQAGTLGVLQDQTATRWPNVLDDSRDVDFVDLDLDGDFDAFISNTSGVVNQTNRFLVNMGGAQGGTAGYFQDQTATRWIDLGVNNGTSSLSSIAPSVVLAGGGFIDWSCDTTMADLDDDGDPDLVNATYGSLSLGRTPTRIFLNDGDGQFAEFNPSGFQLTGTDIINGSPGLWCQGTHQQATTNASGAQCDIANESISVDVGDLDGDYDLDFVLGDKSQLPRVFHNRLEENGGALGFRDTSHGVMPGPNWAPSTGSYEQDLGDLDEDGDLEIYGANWSNVCDTVLFNDGAGNFATPVVVADTCLRGNEPDFIDYDNDGHLDVVVVSRTAAEFMFRNVGPGGGWTLSLDGLAIPGYYSQALGADACDIDLDGDYDLFLATDAGDPDNYFENINQIPDSTAPRVANLEQVANRNAGPSRTVIRAQVYDNASWYVTAFDATTLEYSVNGGAFSSATMRFVGGQLFRGEIPGFIVGSVDYRVRSVDAYGNTGVSATKTFVAAPCTGEPAAYCTAKTNSAGCVPAISVLGVPSASAGSGCLVSATQVLDSKFGLLFYSRSGPNAVPYQGGWFCVQAPTVRTPVQNSGSSGQPPCTGVFSFDFNSWIALGVDPNLGLGQQVWLQYWSRDPQSSFQTNRTDAATLFVCP